MNISHYSGLDVMKMIMAIAVVMIHAPLLLTPDDLYQPLVNEFLLIPVQFFFVASGFLLMHKINRLKSGETPRQTIKQRAFRTAGLWLRWLILYLFLIPVYYSDKGWTMLETVKSCVMDLVFSGSPAYAWPLWFLYSMTIGLVLIGWAYGSKKRMRLLVAAVTLLILAVWGYSHGHVAALARIYTVAHFSLLASVPILCGMLLYRLDLRGRLSVAATVGLLVIAVVMTVFYLPFDNLVGGIAFCMLALKLPHMSRMPYRLLRTWSMWLYFSHMICLLAWRRIAYFFSIDLPDVGLLLGGLTLSLVVSWLFATLQDSPRFAFLKKMT